MASLIRARDWSQTTLGPIETWPQSLKTAIGIMLGAPTPISLYWGDDLLFLYNDAWKPRMGDQHPRGLGRPAREVFPEISAAVSPLLHGGTSETRADDIHHQQLPLNQQGGIEKPALDHSFTPIFREDGKIGGVLSIAATKLDPVRSEQKPLRDSEHFYREILESIPGMLFTTRPDGYCDYQSHQWVDYTGVPIEQHLGDGWNSLLHPDDQPRALASWQAAVQEKAPYDLEYRVRRRDGQYEWFKVIGRPIRDDQGHIVRWFGVALNIEQLKRTEESLRESQQRFRIMGEAVPYGVWWCNERGAPEYVSQSFLNLLEMTLDEVRQSGWARRLPPEEVEPVTRSWMHCVRTGEDWEGEYRVLGPDGNYHYVLSRGKPVRDAWGNILGWVGINLDIDEQKQLQKQRQAMLEAERAARTEFEHMTRLKDEFLATVSHELRSPLSAIVGWSNLLARGRAETARAADIIRSNASSLNQIVEDLLDMGRIVTGKIRLNRRRVSISDLVNNAVHAVKMAAEARSIDLQVTFDDHLEPIECDPTRIQQIIWNLLTNAVKFTPEAGRVQVQIDQTATEVTITVRDTGKGIDPKFLPHLFERFRQEAGGITRKYGGLGLGLSIVRQLVEAHGGTITALSEGEGHGATFVVTLPRSVAAVDAEETPTAEMNPPLASAADLDETVFAGLRILCVDDDTFSCELLQRILADAGATVHTVLTVKEAWAILDEFHPDVLISDLSMPDEDGYALIRRLRTAGDWRSTLPAIAVTALGRSQDRDLALQAGFNAHVSKPFDPGRLGLVIQELILHRRERHPPREEQGDRNDPRHHHAASPPDSPHPPTDGSRPLHVLLAEDHQPVREMIRDMLEENGYRVSVTETVAYGLALVRESPVDLLLSDLNLKDGKAWDLMVKAREVSDIPAIVMSGYNDDHHIARSKQAGCAEYLVKPFGEPDLLAAISRVLAAASAPLPKTH